MKSRRLYRIKELSELIGLSPAAIYEMVRLRKFPGPIRITPKCSVWSNEQVDTWIEAKKAESGVQS